MAHLSITCPNCGHIHDVAEEHFAHTESRLLKCAECDYVWRYYKDGHLQTSVDELDDSEDDNMDEGEETFSHHHDHHESPSQRHAQHTTQAHHMAPNFQAFQDVPMTRKERYKHAVHRYNLDWWMLVISVFVVLFVVVSETGSIPSLQWFYVEAHNKLMRLKNLVFPQKDLSFNKSEVSLQVLTSSVVELHGEPRLNVKCEVVNQGKQDQSLPPVKVSLLDQNDTGELVYRTSWHYRVEDMLVHPGERKIFETSGPCLTKTLPFTVKVVFQED